MLDELFTAQIRIWKTTVTIVHKKTTLSNFILGINIILIAIHHFYS